MRKLFLILFLVTAVGAWANEVQIQTATTQGCFNDHCTLSNTDAITDLSFAGLKMTSPATTVGGNLDIALGKFTLTNGKSTDFSFWTWGTPFKAEVEFTLPPDVMGDLTYKATVFGSVDRNDDGWAWINFDNSVEHFTFANGSFDFRVDDVYLDVAHRGDSDSVQWTGHVTDASQVPEPATLGLVGFGILGLGAKLRRKS